MIIILRIFLRIAVLRANPQDIPHFRWLAILAVLSYGLMSLTISLAQPIPVDKAVFSAVMDTGILMGLAWAVLWIKNLPQRRVQTIAALAGTGTLFEILTWPLQVFLVQLGDATTVLGSLAALAVLMIAAWQIVTIGHILRHALDISFPIGAGIAVLYAIFSIKVAFFIAAT